MTALAGIFLVAHGLVHAAVWLSPQPENAPFDPCRSWLLGEIGPLARSFAVAALVLFVIAGLFALGSAGSAGPTAAVGAAMSLVLVTLTFNRWLSGAVAINVAIAVLALG